MKFILQNESNWVCFPSDSEIQLEFERSFGYELTVDQLRSVEEIKADMEKSTDGSLLCGDVGFGKTEVALRAAFKSYSRK